MDSPANPNCNQSNSHFASWRIHAATAISIVFLGGKAKVGNKHYWFQEMEGEDILLWQRIDSKNPHPCEKGFGKLRLTLCEEISEQDHEENKNTLRAIMEKL